MKRLGPIVIAAAMLASPLPASALYDSDAPVSRVGFHLGLGVGYNNVFSDTLPSGADRSDWLGRFEVGISYAKIVGVKFQLNISTFDWDLDGGRRIPMGHYLQSVDLYTLVPLSDRWRLRPAVGYTFSSALLDPRGTGFYGAHGLNLQLAGEFQLKEVIWLGAGIGYHLTGDYPSVNIEEPGVEIPDEVGAQHLNLYFQIVFSLE